MSYKDYIKSELERAKGSDWYDPDGNNTIATANRSFFAELKKQVKGFNYDIVNSVDLKELVVQVVNVIMMLSLPVTYIPFLLVRTYFTKKRAKKEMMSDYNKSITG